MVIGESFYFPKGSRIHLDAEAWYRRHQEYLNPSEIAFTNCRFLVGGEERFPDFKFYQEIETCLSTVVPANSGGSISHIAFMHAFQRPAEKTGKSFKHYLRTIDLRVAIETVHAVIDIIEPEMVLFVSKFSWDMFGFELAVNPRFSNIYTDFVCHPTDYFHWTKHKYEHGKDKFLGILAERFIRK